MSSQVHPRAYQSHAPRRRSHSEPSRSSGSPPPNDQKTRRFTRPAHRFPSAPFFSLSQNAVVFDLLIRTHVQARKLREGSEAFRLLRQRGFAVSINASNALLGALVKVGWVDLAWTVYEDVVASGATVNAFTFNIMVNAFCKEGRFDEVKVFFVPNGG